MALDRGRLKTRMPIDQIIYYDLFEHVQGEGTEILTFCVTDICEELCLEWWYGKKKLSIYLEDDGTLPSFFRIPVYNDPSCIIVEGDITSLDDAIACWNWLLED